MKTSQDRFFKNTCIKLINNEKVNAVVYGYETNKAIYDVVILEDAEVLKTIPSFANGNRKYLAKNCRATNVKEWHHKAIEEHFGI